MSAQIVGRWSEHLDAWLRDKSMTPAGLADQVNVDATTVRRWRASGEIPWPRVPSVLTATGLPMKALFSEDVLEGRTSYIKPASTRSRHIKAAAPADRVCTQAVDSPALSGDLSIMRFLTETESTAIIPDLLSAESANLLEICALDAESRSLDLAADSSLLRELHSDGALIFDEVADSLIRPAEVETSVVSASTTTILALENAAHEATINVVPALSRAVPDAVAPWEPVGAPSAAPSQPSGKSTGFRMAAMIEERRQEVVTAVPAGTVLMDLFKSATVSDSQQKMARLDGGKLMLQASNPIARALVCQYIIGDPLGSYKFCQTNGKPTPSIRGKSYCREHTELCYVKVIHKKALTTSIKV